MNSARQVPSVASPIPGVSRRISGSLDQADSELLAVLKRTLLIAALETPPRFRSDVDVVMIEQHLASLGAFAAVAPQILHYLATECTINRIPDGEVLFYQEDVVDDHSDAYIILEGSLCGYFNKAFHQRHSRRDNFRSWNSKQTNARGVTIDFGDLQVTYGKGAICGIDDFHLGALTPPNRSTRHHVKPLFSRRRSVHSQESTTIIVLAKDTLDRVSERFGLIYEKGVLTSTMEMARTDVSHLALFSLLSDTAKKALLQSALIRQLEIGEVLFAEKNSTAAAFVVLRNGRLDIHCIEYGEMNPVKTAPVNTENASSASSNIAKGDPSPSPVPKEPIVSLTRGQTFGDQMVVLGHPHIWMSNPRRRRQFNVEFKVVASEPSTEVLWVPREQYEHLVREDHLRLSYNPIFGSTYTAYTTAALVSAIESRDICQTTRLVLSDARLSKFFFQFPPLVLDRLCHHMEIQHFVSSGVLIETGGSIDGVFVVVAGALRSHHFSESGNDHTSAQKVIVHQGMSLVHFIPGDAFGARELMKRCSTSEAPVLAEPGTTVLCISRPAFERWVSPMRHNTIVKAGSILQPFVLSNSSPSTSPRRQAYPNNYASLMKVNRRQSGPSVFSSSAVEPDRSKASRLDDAANFLKQFGLFQTLPRFLLAQMLAHATLLSKSAGEELFREGDTHRALVVVLSGFVSFYSLENMTATIDMFQKHPFCTYAAFSGSTINPEDYVSEPRVDENALLPQAGALKHRAAMHGVHIQTLPPRNAFRTGVLKEGTQCPANVLAQTDCEYLVIEETVYTRLLAEHVPAVDVNDYIASLTSLETTAPISSGGNGTESSERQLSVPQATSKATAPATDQRPDAIPAPLLALLETAHIPWLPPSSAKRTLLLHSMQHVYLTPGQRFIQCNDTLEQVVLVVRGKLGVYVRESQEVASILDASQRSVQSAALERSVASNYSTTSQQLFQERSSTNGTANRKALQRKIARIAEMKTPETDVASSNTHFTDFVMHAAREQIKARQLDKTEDSEQISRAPKPPPGTRSLHSMVKKVKFQRQVGDQSTIKDSTSLKEANKALFVFHLGPGDTYGEEVTAPSGIFRSVHDIYADTSASSSPGVNESGSKRSLMGIEVLCLDRHVLHSTLAKTEEEAAHELLGKSSNAKARWQVASKKLFKRASHSTFEEPGTFSGRKKMPKLFDFFKNILNQRRFLTMGIIAHFPILRDLTDDARRELCLNARFEALDRYTDAYKSNGDGNRTARRFFLLLAGRINLVANGPNSHIVSQSTNSDHSLSEVSAGEGFGEFGILMPDAPAYIAAIAAEPTKLLCIPSEMFLRHWPRIRDARANIEYLQTQIPSLVSLDLERIAYLYHSFSFETHFRRTSIFQLHDTKTKEVYLIKEGTCCIRQHITLINRTDADFHYGSCNDDHLGNQNGDPQLSRTKKKVKTIKVLATVADVGAGHVFWNEVDHYPITLVATSAVVTVASISIDKLKAIVPRGSLVGLEELSDQLRELYAQQFELAKRAAATVMNGKQAAQRQRPEMIGRLPTINRHNTQKVYLSVQSPVAQEEKILDNAALESGDGISLLTERANTFYNAQHRIERYNIPNQLPASNLAGSFLDQQTSRQDVNDTEDNATGMDSQEYLLKQDEYCSPEHTTEAIALQQKDATRMLRLDVKIPVAGRLKNRTPPESAECRRLSKTSEISAMLLPQETTVRSQNGAVMYEADVRASIHARLSMIDSPMRSIRLEPSNSLVHSLGKYYPDSPSPFSKPGDSFRRGCVQLQQQLPTSTTRSRVKPPKQKAITGLRSNPKLLQATGPVVPELTRKELNQACVLGGLQHLVSIKMQRPIIPTPPQPAESAALAAVIDAFKGRRGSTLMGRRSSICVPKPVDELQVEYRIS